MSNKTSQKEAVFTAVSRVLTEAGVQVKEGDNFSEHLNRELRAQVTNILVEGFNGGTIALDKSFEDEAALRTYCSGVTSNWLRKDPRLNGGMKYTAKNPGSRVGSSDPQVKAMRILLNSGRVTEESERSKIQSMIDARVSEIKAASKPAKAIDFASLPADLAAKYGE